MTAKLYSLPAFRAGQRQGLARGAAVIFARHTATEMDQDGMLHQNATSVGEVAAAVAESQVDNVSDAREGRQPEHPLVHDLGGQYGYFVGQKYERLDVAEIAKRVRTEIKDLVKGGKLPKGKYGVTISRFSGGRSMSIRVRDLPPTFPLLNPERVLIEASEPHTFHPDCHYPRYTPEGKAMLDTLNAVSNAYRYDRSDSMSDYFDTNFYLHVDVDGDVEAAARAAILAKATG